MIGLGHIGLPLAVQYASRGHDVTGVDIDERIVDDPQPWRVAACRRAGARRARPAPRRRRAACAQRPGRTVGRARSRGGRRHRPGRGRRAARDRLRADRRGHARPRGQPVAQDALVVYETTLPVGTTRDRFGPMLAQGSGLELDRDLFLAFSPERVLVGRVLLDLRRYPKIVGGTSAESTRRAVEFYRSVLDEGTEVWAVADAETAEMASWPRRRTATSTSPTPTSSRASPRGEGSTSPRSSVRRTRSRTATSTSRASASAATASRSTPTSSSTASRTCACRRWPAQINESHGPLRRRHDRGPHRLARRPAGARARHRLPRRRATRTPSAPPSACATSCWRPGRASTATTRTSRRSPPRARLRAVRARLRRSRCASRSSRPRTRRIGRSTRPSCPGSSCSSTGGTRSIASRSNAPGSRYVGIGR